MVKAYLRYVQEKVISGLVGPNSNIKLCKVKGKETRYCLQRGGKPHQCAHWRVRFPNLR